MTDDQLPLRLGDAGSAVHDLQHRLRRAGFSIEPDAPGEFGPGTEQAVRGFQAKRGLQADGWCGPQTWAALVEAGFQLGDRLLYLTRPMLRGDDIADLQRRLGSLGFDAGRIDGIFGPDSVHALAEFQRNAGLTPDAICGPGTVSALDRLGPRTIENDPVVVIRETERRRERVPVLEGARIALGERGELASLSEAVARRLRTSGADVLLLHDPDESRQAAQANTWDAEAFVSLAIGEQARISFYGRPEYFSAGGRRLADIVAEQLASCTSLPGVPAGTDTVPMTVPILRETRMPAVRITWSDPAVVVMNLAEIAGLVAGAVGRWCTETD